MLPGPPQLLTGKERWAEAHAPLHPPSPPWMSRAAFREFRETHAAKPEPMLKLSLQKHRE
ncbi:hypothetical protein PSm6_36210 [Pseudomonas solani]|uniref:Uncharacterized protein n=1 Tax=Pseudomonas solani TaxID=2731552 RepID=A0ABM7LCJ0_9PSED|nr:hypothetical protein PSm6_36210 [Pseudomonas solani]